MLATTFQNMASIATGRSRIVHWKPRIAIRLIWADKLALAIAVMGLALFGYLWLLTAIATGTSGADYLFRHEIAWGLDADVTTSVCAWLFFRSVDFASGGPRRRASHHS